MNWNRMFDYHQWATEKVFDHLSSLDEPVYKQKDQNSSLSIEEMTTSLIGTEKLWLMRIIGMRKPAFEHFDMGDAIQAKEQFMLLHAEMELFFASLTESQWEETVGYTDLHGKDFADTREEMLFTLVTHASYYRGQIDALLRQFGEQGIPPVDYPNFAEENR